MTVADNLCLHKIGEKVGFFSRVDGRFEVKVSSSVPSLQKMYSTFLKLSHQVQFISSILSCYEFDALWPHAHWKFLDSLAQICPGWDQKGDEGVSLLWPF